MNCILKLLFIAASLLFQAVSPATAGEDSARDWLEQMSRTLQSTNFRGTFIYQYAGKVDAMRIVHAVHADGEWEKLSSLTGPRREVIRNNEMVTCILGDKQSVVLNKSQPRQPFPASWPADLGSIEKHYRFEFAGEDRVAGLTCRLIAIQPRDAFRYGQRLCIGMDNRILLRSELTGSDGTVIERVMFTEINFPQRITEAELRPEYQGSSYRWVREPSLSLSGKPRHTAGVHWQFTGIPDGFMQTSHAWHQLSEDQPAVEHWVFSDGLASVSVYIEKARPEGHEYSGISRRGALNAFGTMADGHYVTAVGAVPLATLEQIARSVHYKP